MFLKLLSKILTLPEICENDGFSYTAIERKLNRTKQLILTVSSTCGSKRKISHEKFD
jgi:hypothetical protein